MRGKMWGVMRVTAIFLIIKITEIGASGSHVNNFSDVIGHILPAYAIAVKSGILEGSSLCRTELEIFKEGVDTRKVWSLRMLDSSGSPKPGFIYGNNYWLGSRSQCFDTMNSEPLELHPEWLKNNSLYRNPEEEVAPYELNYFVAQLRHNSTLQYHHRFENEDVMALGLCLPGSCGISELEWILEKIFQEREFPINEVYGVDLRLIYVKDLNDEPEYLMNWRMMIVMIVIVFTVIMMVMGTWYDVRVHRKRDNMSKLMSDNNKQKIIGTKNIENGESQMYSAPETRNGRIEKFLICFSVYTNSKNLFDISKRDSVPALNGIRFLSMVWIIMVHMELYGQDYSDNRTWAWRVSSRLLTQIISSGALSVDTYFFLSGFLLAHVYFKSKKSKSPAVIREKNHQKTFFRDLTMCMVKRFIRLTPAYMMTVGIVEMTSSFLNNTSQFYMTERPHETCAKYWWRNILYINNFFSRKEMCLSWSWYLSNDTQFFIFGTMLLLMSAKYFYTSMGILIATILASCTISGYDSYVYEHVATLDEQWSTLNLFYDPPWMRIGPYLIGIATAYLLFKMRNKLNVKRKTLCVLWTIGSCTNLLVLFGLYGRSLSIITMSIYMGLYRTAWGIGIAWVVFACSTNNAGIVNSILSLKAWGPLSKLTFCAFLMNPFVISFVYLSSESSLHIDAVPNVILSLGFVLVTYICAYVTYLMFEVPYILLLKLYFDSGKSRRFRGPTMPNEVIHEETKT